MALHKVFMNDTDGRKKNSFFSNHTFQSQTPALCDVTGDNQIFALLYLCFKQVALLLSP